MGISEWLVVSNTSVAILAQAFLACTLFNACHRLERLCGSAKSVAGSSMDGTSADRSQLWHHAACAPGLPMAGLILWLPAATSIANRPVTGAVVYGRALTALAKAHSKNRMDLTLDHSHSQFRLNSGGPRPNPGSRSEPLMLSGSHSRCHGFA